MLIGNASLLKIMDADQGDPMLSSSCSKPLHVQRVERATDLNVFLQERRKEKLPVCSSDEEAIIVDENPTENFDFLNDGEDGADNIFFNVDFNDGDRSWLTEILQEESVDSKSNSIASQCNSLMQIHKKKKLLGLNEEKMELNMYYGAGLISNFDKYPENKKAVLNKYPKKKHKPEETITKPTLYTVPEVLQEIPDEQGVYFDIENGIDLQTIDEDSNKTAEVGKEHLKVIKVTSNTATKKQKAKKFKDEESKRKWEEMMLIKRKKVFTAMVKKEISKQQRAKVNKHKEMLIQCKRVALQCQKVVRNKALQSARAVKELQWRMKRLARENLAYWKRSKRVDREMRRKLEKEAEEQRKMDFELIEAKRQQRKLNFLITQTELYAHFMSRKIADSSPEEQLRILSQLDEEKNPRLANIDDYDSDMMKAKAIKNAQDAFQNEKARTREFDQEANISSTEDGNILGNSDEEHVQPTIFQGTLKAYQLRGMNWLANLYDQGISGILADEMGLGKTVQSIAFLSHLAEKHDLWGPFLVICPASTLHNWQQEFAKFVPMFIVVPYWGNPTDRKILRQFWNQDGMHTRDAGFHVVITSYQIVISDVKYFNRIKWQYMVLDEAQAIKSTSSMRWKTLLGFNCRNRLLLSGTPIQNSMAELWALLHFIMPTLFDSHEEFNEWFSKDIESHAENKTGIDEKHLSRLHMILKPFMLRRIKKDVENELSDKIEVMVYCPLTTRQKLLYMALKQKIRIEDLLHYTVGGGDSHSVDKNFTSNLMNLVMQFRKVCNHPELFERRDAKSPIFIPSYTFHIPYEVFDVNVRQEEMLKLGKYFVFTPEYISRAMIGYYGDTIFNFCVFMRLTPDDMYKLFRGDILRRWINYFEIENRRYNTCYRKFWSDNLKKIDLEVAATFKLCLAYIHMSLVLQNLVFTLNNSGKKVCYTHTSHLYHSMPETVEHRNVRCRPRNEEGEAIIDVVNDDPTSQQAKLQANSSQAREFHYKKRPSQVLECERTELPSFLFSVIPKVATNSPQLFCPSRRVAYYWLRHLDDWSLNSLNYHYTKATGHVLYKTRHESFHPEPTTSLDSLNPVHGWSHIMIPDKETLVTDSGKLSVLDGLLKKLKEGGHRVLIYSQMTKMIDLLEEYMWHRHHKYMRLDGSSKISERRDMVADFQARTDIFVFLLSTRAGGLGINLTAADTVIFYDSDWNPTVDQQAMDRAHRLGQTKQVTVYRLICKGSIEERILQRAREKSEIQKLVISGGNFKPDTLKPKEVVSLLLDDEEIEQKYRQRTEERRHLEDMREMDRKRKYMAASTSKALTSMHEPKRKPDSQESGFSELMSQDSTPSSPRNTENSPELNLTQSDDVNDSDFLDIEGDAAASNKLSSYNAYSGSSKPRVPGRGTSKRGRPRGSRRTSALGRFNTSSSISSTHSSIQDSGVESTSIPPSPSMLTYDGTTNSSSFTQQTPSTSHASNPTRRGPGRPRLKPSGPSNTGTRGTYRPRKPARPLPVPLPSDTTSANPSNATASTSYSTYIYNFSEQSDS
ncbi:SNF2-related domain [Popillia japonica]|uniref:Chromatin-remodeling ATPase INO80 n=1 Tax=Popillia japonica TaxID=7064 RepID=A0AAW1MTK6_POPJA